MGDLPALPSIGTVEGVIRAARAVDIHSDVYDDVAFVPAGSGDGGGAHALRVPGHARERALRAGDRVRLTLLMGQVEKVEIVEDGG